MSMHVCMCLRSLDKPSFGEQRSVGITVYGVYCVLMVNQESKRRVGGHLIMCITYIHVGFLEKMMVHVHKLSLNLAK